MGKHKRKYIIAAALVALAAIVYLNRGALAMAGFDWFLQGHVEKKIEKTYKPAERTQPPVAVSTTKEQKKEPFAVLLLGVDQRGNEVGRSDTMIYTVVRPEDGNILLVSIPRDLYVEIVGRDIMDKANHSYAFGGAGMAMDTVEKLLDSPVHHYASVNFEGFRDVIDAMGGIALPIEKDMVNRDPNHDYFFIKGGQDLYDGTDALNFVRYREDAGGDLSRTERQQQFLHAMIEKALEMKQWTKIPELLDIMDDNFNTDILPSKLVDLAQELFQAKQRTMYSHTLAGEGHRLKAGGAWYFFADEEDLAQVRSMIKSWLDEDTPAGSLPLPPKYAAERNKEVKSLSSAANGTE